VPVDGSLGAAAVLMRALRFDGWLNCSGWSPNWSPRAPPIADIRARLRETMGGSQAWIQADRRREWTNDANWVDSHLC
jgi:hypothetical protein